ncbi:permease for cytosine/purines uracil thiamine allantoin [Kribbella flavida DSM 17836]|uniref:Permease for cytosine/purines uracil thiamine allantoin n=1 Tax=Kribbella flavida (strain DSM 17836 / JCM 10339 / NBRC 14399) TaxID=479435 RepID=D2PRX7_KRIFD|nr:cytosine permease [Kribbella flavida]ADB29307.1 permease for cytosine/purines uracil thiamine allantoin [Kribbella flavida DSM 17836]
MAFTAVRKSTPVPTEAPLVLTTDAPRTLGFWDQFTLWGNLGISLFGPVTGALVAAYTGSLVKGLLAVVVGCGMGALVLGGAAVFGSQTGAPAMASLRGLFGRRGSAAPTVLNIAQNVGWATMEIIVISQAAVAVTSERWRWLFVILAGVLATAMAVRPLGSVKLLRKFMVWLVLLASVYLFFQVLSKPVHDLPQDSVFGFWPAVDLAAAGVVSFAPLAADYTRHSRTNKAAFAGSALGYGLAAILYYGLGVLAVATLQTNSADVITALVTLPAGAIALFVLLVDEVDEAYANVYSTTMAAHNLVGHLDRRWISVVIGVIATVLALFVDLGNYTQFLYLIGSVFIPLFAVAIADFFLVSRMRWDVSDTAPFRWQPAAAWLCGFVAYQLVNPGTVGGWSPFWLELQSTVFAGHAVPGWLGATYTSIVVSMVAAVAFGAIGRRRAA